MIFHKTYPLSILMILMLIFSKTAHITAQKSTDFCLNWQITHSLPLPHIGVAGAFGGVSQETMLLAGGANFPDKMPWEGGKKKYSNEIFVFTKNKKGKINRLNQTFHLPNTVAYGASVSTPKGIVCIGGENENGISDKTFLMLWNILKRNIEIQNFPNLPIPLTNVLATADENTIFIAGGETLNAVSDKFYSLDLGNKKAVWKALPPLPKPLSHAVLIKDKNKPLIYLIGGRQKKANGISELYKTVYVFDIDAKSWTEKKPLPYPLSAGTGIAVNDHILMLFGGDKGDTFHKVEMLLAAINAEEQSDNKQALIEQKNQLLATHPGFSKALLMYDTMNDNWSKIGDMPFDTPVTTTVFKWNERVIIPGGEIKAGIRTPHILAVDILEKKK